MKNPTSALLVSLCLPLLPIHAAKDEPKPSPRIALDAVGVNYSFPRDGVPDVADDAVYVVFVGTGKSGWNPKVKADYPLELRYVISPIYRLAGMPPSYDWKRLGTGLSAVLGKAYHEFLIEKHGFTADLHYAGGITSRSLADLEKRLSEDIHRERKFSPKKEFVITGGFSFSFKDTVQSPFIYNNAASGKYYSVEYNAPR